MKIFKKIIKIAGIVLLIVFIGLYSAAYWFLSPESDTSITEKLKNPYSTVYLEHHIFRGFDYRVVSMQQQPDTTLPTLVFVHGSPGSILDYKRYFKDSLLNSKANMIGYERVGYGLKNTGEVQSLNFEVDLLNEVTKSLLPEKTVLVGYSYGGTVVLASPRDYKNKVAIAAAVDAGLEPMFWVLKFYNWKLTRWLIPKKLQAATKEKYMHLQELPEYKDKWNTSPAPILDIQGNSDRIVPYNNSMVLQKLITPDKFKLITLNDTGHELIWTKFEEIRNEILKTLE